MTVRRALTCAGVTLLTPLLLSGCGGSHHTSNPSADGASPDARPTAVPSTPRLSVPDGVKLEKPSARATIEPSATLTAVPGASQMSAPREAPRTIEGFPVPDGAKVKDPGAIEQTWQFDIDTKDPTSVIDFYERVLPQMGYRVRTDVTYTVAYETQHWDVVFDGPVSGSMVADPGDGTVFVVVNPPGQPAFAGDAQ
ncbi:MAG: hypothetical protein ACJ72E_04290 [Marmoricola sp.]